MQDSTQRKLALFAIGFLAPLLVILAIGRSPVQAPAHPMPQPPVSMPAEVTPQPEPPKPQTPTDPELADVQVPIPRDIRLFNRSGSQCVWVTLKMLGTYHHVKGTSDLDRFLHATGSGEVAQRLTQRNVKFKQTNRNGLAFLKEWVQEKRMGCGIGVNGNHMILCCHYEEGKCVKVIDNGDRQLRIQTWDWQRFRRSFDGWAVVILPDDYAVATSLEDFFDNGRLYYGR